MMAVFAGVLAFAAAFAAWRWLLGSRNWLEGAIVALVAGTLVGLLTQAAGRVAAHL